MSCPFPPFKFSKGKQEGDWAEGHWFEFHIDRFSKWIPPGQPEVSGSSHSQKRAIHQQLLQTLLGPVPPTGAAPHLPQEFCLSKVQGSQPPCSALESSTPQMPLLLLLGDRPLLPGLVPSSAVPCLLLQGLMAPNRPITPLCQARKYTHP